MAFDSKPRKKQEQQVIAGVIYGPLYVEQALGGAISQHKSQDYEEMDN